MSSQGSTLVGAVVAILIIGAVGTLAYYQFEVAPNQAASGTTSTGPTIQCPSSACVNVTIPVNAATTPPGFSPNPVTVVIGKNNTVFWLNNDTTGTPHTVTPKIGPDMSWGSGTLNEGDTYQYTFTVAGTYTYYCTFHPTVMIGTVIVKSG